MEGWREVQAEAPWPAGEVGLVYFGFSRRARPRVSAPSSSSIFSALHNKELHHLPARFGSARTLLVSSGRSSLAGGL